MTRKAITWYWCRKNTVWHTRPCKHSKCGQPRTTTTAIERPTNPR